jgi:hypothetical protein
MAIQSQIECLALSIQYTVLCEAKWKKKTLEERAPPKVSKLAMFLMKGLSRRNTHVKYESPSTYQLKIYDQG